MLTREGLCGRMMVGGEGRVKFKIKGKGWTFRIGQITNFYDHTDELDGGERELGGFVSNIEGDIITITSADWGYINEGWNVRLELPNYFEVV